MSGARVATWAAVLFIPAVLWGFLNSARNDLLARTRSMIGQVQRIELENEKAQASFFIHTRFPDGDRSRQEMLFGRLWYVLHECETGEISYRGETKLKRCEDGREHNCRQVVVEGRDREEHRDMKLVLDWVQYQGSWYLNGATDEATGRDLSEVPSLIPTQ